jgi:CRP-like cAMP-binding protein
MELLETARVDAYRQNDVILSASRRSQLLCVVWEGTCSESLSSINRPASPSSKALTTVNESPIPHRSPAVWHAGDWTGPISLQPDRVLSGESSTSTTHDVVAVSSEGVKVITVEIAGLHCILKTGSALYRKYLERKAYQERAKMDVSTSEHHSTATERLLDDALKDLNVLDLLNCNSALRKLNAVQKRHLESLAEGPIGFQPGERLWRAGGTVDRAFVIISGSASFVPKRRNAGSATVSSINNGEDDKHGESNIGAHMHIDAKKVVRELGKVSQGLDCEGSLSSREQEDPRSPAMSLEKVFNKGGTSDRGNPDFERLRQGLERRANHVNMEGSVASADLSLDHESYDTDNDSQLDYTFIDDADAGTRSNRSSVIRRRSSRARKANKVLGRLYNRRAFTGGLVFSRGHFLGDVSKMVAGLLASDLVAEAKDEGPLYGFGDHVEGAEGLMAELIIQEEEGAETITHSSTLTAGKDGCVVLVFPKTSIIPFLDQYPGLLLSLLGTQVVV